MRLTTLATLLTLGACAAPVEDTAPADVVLSNGRVYTLAWSDPDGTGAIAPDAPFGDQGWHPDAEAIAIRGDRIVRVGSLAQVSELIVPATRIIDLAGATVLPGLTDSHSHAIDLGRALASVDLFGVKDEAEAVARVAAHAAGVPEGEWIVGRGWDEGAWANNYPDARLLTRQVPRHPVFLRSLHSFAGWGNALALERAGITRHTPAIDGGEIIVDAAGEPTGMLLNRAVELFERAVPAPTHQQRMTEIELALAQMGRDGFTTIHEAGVDGASMRAFEALEAAGELPIRVYAMLSVRDVDLAKVWLARGPDRDAARMLVTRSVKAFYDGALGSRGARLLDDYSDLPGHRGVSGDEYGFDEALVAQLMRAGFQVGVHAIGDLGNRETLNFFQREFAQTPATASLRHRIEHAQVLHADDLPRFAQLKVIASMEPPHAVEDMTWAGDRLGPERVKGAYAWRSLRRSGAQLTFNADNPGSDHSIFYGLHAALTRRDKSLEPKGGWYPEQALTIEEAIRAYTTWSAFAAFRERDAGIIAAGRWADLTVMDIDPFVTSSSDPGQLLAATSS
ncbi:MAG: amidohydrolase [Gammaproteobacteria bacterium]|nr:amidohydrolase [Gammaproteobacteria bacterium]